MGFAEQWSGFADRQVAAGDDDLPHRHQVFQIGGLPQGLEGRIDRRNGGDHLLGSDELEPLQHIHTEPGERQADVDPAAVQQLQHIILRGAEQLDIE
ncbi:hypothetical protein D3C86_1836990 [compost metagenome]